MGEVVEYYQFSSMKAPPPPQPDDLSLSSPSALPPASEPPFSPPPPPPASPPSTSSSPPSSSSTSSSSQSLPLSYAQWQSERAEMVALDRCAVTATWRMVSTAAFTSVLAAVYRHYQGRSKVQMAISATGVFLFTTALTWQVWAKPCAEDFFQSDGAMAERGRAALRREMTDHPLLLAYEQKQRDRGGERELEGPRS